MVRLAIALTIVLAVVSTATAQPTEMPDISAKCFLTAVYGDYSTSIEARLKEALSDPTHQLSKIRSQCVFNEWNDSDTIVQKTDWKNYLGIVRPVLLLQGRAEKNGTADVIFVAIGSELHNLDVVLSNIRLSLNRYSTWLTSPAEQRGTWQRQRCGPQGCFPRGREQRVDPKRDTPAPKLKQPSPIQPLVDLKLPGVSVVVPPDVKEKEEKPVDEDDGFPLWLLLIPVLGGGAGLLSHLRDQS